LLFQRRLESGWGEIAVKGYSLIDRCGVGVDSLVFVVGCDVAFRFLSELLFFACPKNK
jgi:hypothetical protein